MEYFLIGLAMSVLIAVVLGGIVGYSLLMERLAARHPRPKSESDGRQEATRAATSPAPSPPTLAERAGAHIMSRFLGAAGPVEPIATEQRSYAVERPREQPGTVAGELVPELLEQLEQLDDDALLDILAGLRGEDGAYRFAESRVAKFIPGRLEDRLAQVRDVRGTEKPMPPGRVLRVRDERGERVITL
jgi:hypothetical protein